MPSAITITASAGLSPNAQWRELLEQIGAGNPALPLVDPLADFPDVTDGKSLVAFLKRYRDEVLLPEELPLISRSFSHAARFQARELIELDRNFSPQGWWSRFASASRTAGAAQLHRLRPLRDERMVQRYLAAVESGEANGWHTVVFGLVLSIYSAPLRQGLLHYARQTLGEWRRCGCAALVLSEADQTRLEAELDMTSEQIAAAITECAGVTVV